VSTKAQRSCRCVNWLSEGLRFRKTHRVGTCPRSSKALCSCSDSPWAHKGDPGMPRAPPALLHCSASTATAHMAPSPDAGEGRDEGSWQPQPLSLGAHPTACSQSTPNAHRQRWAACRAQQGPSSLKTCLSCDGGGNGDGTTVWWFFFS